MGKRIRPLPENHDGSKTYSYSEFGQFEQCTWSYYLNRLKKVKGEDNIYSKAGGLAHDIIEAYEKGEISHEDMAKLYVKEFNALLDSGYRFAHDEQRHNTILEKYYYDIKHFFKYYQSKAGTEQEDEMGIYTDIEGRYLIGFVDKKFVDEEGFLNIVDYKTSTFYNKSDREKNEKQFLIYAKSFLDKGQDIKKIRAYWNFLKYANIKMKIPKKYSITLDEETKDKMIEDGVITKRTKKVDYYALVPVEVFAERIEIHDRIKSNLKKIMTYEGYSQQEIDQLITDISKEQDISVIPKRLRDKYEITMEEGIWYVEVTPEKIKSLETTLLEEIEKIEQKLKLTEEAENEDKVMEVWQREPLTQSDEFYCSTLCSYNHACEYFKAYMEDKEMFIDEQHRKKTSDIRGSVIDSIDINDIDVADLDFDVSTQNPRAQTANVDLDDLLKDLEI